MEMRMEDITDRQRQTLTFIAAYLAANDCPPTLQEIAAHLGVVGNLGVLRHLRVLERKGYLRRRPGARGIVLAARAGYGQAVPVPVVGTVRAGVPMLAVEHIEEYCATDPSWVKGEGCFYLQVKGDSMLGAHICDGDLALIRPQAMVENGEIVVALLDGEATLKRFFRTPDGGIILKAENPAYAPIEVAPGEAETLIVGKLLRTVRRYQ
jgi:repressor LexA